MGSAPTPLQRAAARHSVPVEAITAPTQAVRAARGDAACELYESGFSVSEVAQILGMTEQGMRVMLWRLGVRMERKGRRR